MNARQQHGFGTHNPGGAATSSRQHSEVSMERMDEPPQSEASMEMKEEAPPSEVSMGKMEEEDLPHATFGYY